MGKLLIMGIIGLVAIYFGSRYIFRGRRDGDNVRTGSK